MNKRGQELSTTTVVLIILAVLVLIFLIIGVVYGWQTIFPWLKPAANVDSVKQQCELACSGGQVYNYCSLSRELVSETEDLKNVNCNFLNVQESKYGIANCPGVACANVPVSAKSLKEASALCVANAGKVIEYLNITTAPNGELKTTACS